MRTPVALTDSVKPGVIVMQKRRRFKQAVSLSDRLKTFAEEVKAKADQLRPGPEKDLLLRKARQADTAAHLEEWANSPGLQPPK